MITPVSTPQSRLLDADRAGVTEEFSKNNWLLQNLPFDDVQASWSHGVGFAYTYKRESTDVVANTRVIGGDYPASTAEVSNHTVLLSALGEDYGIDTLLDGQDAGAQIDYQIREATKVVAAKFSDLLVNGDSANDGEFDGILKSIANTTNTVSGATIDLTAMNTQAAAQAFLLQLDNVLSLVREHDKLAILTNRVGMLQIKRATTLASVTSSADVRGSAPIPAYAGVPIVNLGAKSGSNNDIVATVAGTSDFIVVGLGKDAFHCIYPTCQPLFEVTTPNFDTTDSVAYGRVEMVAAGVLKNSKGAAVLKSVKIA